MTTRTLRRLHSAVRAIQDLGGEVEAIEVNADGSFVLKLAHCDEGEHEPNTEEKEQWR
jgi:hypothetical protein